MFRVWVRGIGNSLCLIDGWMDGWRLYCSPREIHIFSSWKVEWNTAMCWRLMCKNSYEVRKVLTEIEGVWERDRKMERVVGGGWPFMVVSFRNRISRVVGCALPVGWETLRWWWPIWRVCVCVCAALVRRGNPSAGFHNVFSYTLQSWHVFFFYPWLPSNKSHTQNLLV